jgi:drug/metabolite transporter (DMT)-like permease
VWWLTTFAWSTVWLVIKVGVTTVPPLRLAAVRLLLAAVLITLAGARHLRVSARDAVVLAGTGFLLLGVNYGLLFWGAQYVPSGLTAVLQAGTPALGLLFAWALGQERISLAKVIALATGFAGVALISWKQMAAGSLAGCVAIVMASGCVAVAYVSLKILAVHVAPTTVLAYQLWAAAIPLTLASIAVEGNPLSGEWTPRALLVVGYLTLIGSVAAAWLNVWLLQRMDASALLFMGIVEAPVAVALGAVFLHERLGAWTIAGGLLVLGSVSLIAREQRSRQEAG